MNRVCLRNDSKLRAPQSKANRSGSVRAPGATRHHSKLMWRTYSPHPAGRPPHCCWI